MAAKTFVQLYTDGQRVSDTLTGTDAAAAKQIIKDGINESYSEIAGLRDWEELKNTGTVTTSSGTMEYTPITSSATIPRIRRLVSIIDESSNRYLEQIKQEDFLQTYPYIDTSSVANQGTPQMWFPTEYDSNNDLMFKVFQVPNSALTLRLWWFEEPVELNADADKPRIPDQYHYGLVYGGLAKWYEFISDQKATYYRQMHEQFKRKILDAEYGSTDEMPAMQPLTRNNGFVKGKIGRIYN